MGGAAFKVFSYTRPHNVTMIGTEMSRGGHSDMSFSGAKKACERLTPAVGVHLLQNEIGGDLRNDVRGV